MRPFKAMYNVASFLVRAELTGLAKEVVIKGIRQAHRNNGPSDDAPPPARSGDKKTYRVVDVSGGKLSSVDTEFGDAEAFRGVEGGEAVLVTLRVEKTDGGKGMAAYIHGRRVGWYTHQRVPLLVHSDFEWMKRLHRGGFHPRFKGIYLAQQGKGHQVYFLMPSPSSLPSVGECRNFFRESAG